MISSIIKFGTRALWLAICLSAALPAAAAAIDIEAARLLLIAGKHKEAIAAASSGIAGETKSPEWPLLLAQGLGEVGGYEEARDVLLKATKEWPLNLEIRLAAYEAAKHSGSEKEAGAQLEELERLASNRAWAYRSPAERVALGRVALLFNLDPKKVLEQFFDPVRKEKPEYRESYLASGELALEKNDFALAAKSFIAAAKKFPGDADIQFGLARAYAPSDGEAMKSALDKALKANANHVGAHLLLADHYIDAEAYQEAGKELETALQINPFHPLAHAYRAVLANLRADDAAEKEARAAALKSWPKNPEVPHLIGRKLSQKYRFAEGAELQKEALRYDQGFVPAAAQLANDLLRLGKDEEGWKLAEEVQKADPYDVVAYNLTTLREAISHFRTLTNDHFTVRMDPLEADIYGNEVLALLDRAYAAITKKYGLQLRQKTIVEIFPNQKDFAIRTFGLPGGSGYLGVCFGGVITANSPAAHPGSPSNWEAVLWHEFTHVVTLTLTKNKMPRWLSEGISVYEERQARASWGEQMKPRYRAMILGEDLTPVSQLSGAFLQPKTPFHLGFAYYESSLVVEWLTQRWGLEKMKSALADLARGVPINRALANHFEPIEKLDAEFAEHARQLANNTGPKLNWDKPKPSDFANEKAASEFIKENPDNYTALTELSKRLLQEKKWMEAKAPLQRLIELYPDEHNPEGAHAQLAKAHRELGETEEEIAALTRLTELTPDATDAFQRLMQLSADRKEWAKVIAQASGFSAVDPMQPAPHRFTGEANEALGNNSAAIAAYRTLLKLDPPDPPEIHYRLARLMHEGGDPAAKRHLLMALEEAPRFRAAHELLLQINDKPSPKSRVTP
ncbi:MAG: Tetratricopeptide repeat protein [Chthoniobacteraceae bacterium]|nr:Tetratricopeptide repeat protein [Chthoniobacteraceae bacterium]